MGPDLNPRVLLIERNIILDNILKGLKGWDGSIESGLDLVESNEESLRKLKIINFKLRKALSSNTDNEEYEYRLNLILGEQRKFTQGLKSKQNQLLQNFQQLGKRRNVADSYISNKRGPMFIDKDL